MSSNKANPLLAFTQRCDVSKPWWTAWPNTRIIEQEYPDQRVYDAYKFIHEHKITSKVLLNYILADTQISDRWGCLLEIVYFVQDNMVHIPVLEPSYDALFNLDKNLYKRWQLQDPLPLLVLGEGRCFVTSLVLVYLLQNAGFDAETLQLDRHVVVQVCLEHQWYIVDADAFKDGILFFKEKDVLYTKDEILQNPMLIDQFEATGWKFKRNSHFLKNSQGKTFSGYIDPYDAQIDGPLSDRYKINKLKGPPC